MGRSLTGLPPYLRALFERAGGVIREQQLPHDITVDPGQVGVMDTFKGVETGELRMIRDIVKRVHDLAAENGIAIDSATLMMDIANVHAHSQPIALFALLTSSDDDLTHDTLGIHRHIDRTNGRLASGFRLRHARAPS